MIDRTNLLGLFYGLLTVILHLWGRYKSWWWYDNLAHLSAGISLGALLSTPDSPRRETILNVLGLAILWEIAEFVTNTYPWTDLPDRAAAEETVLDTILVLFGAWLATDNN